MRLQKVLAGWLIGTSLGTIIAQTKLDLRTQSKSVDFSAASSTKPVRTGTALPVGCSAAEIFFNSSATPGANLYLCAAVNTWTQVQGAGPSGANFRQAFSNVTSVTLAHSLNTFALVFACFDNTTPPLWILPKSAALTDANTLTVTFASTQSGSCVASATGGGSYTAGTGVSITGSTVSVDKTSVPTFLTSSASLAFGSIAQAACAQLTFALTGASPGDSVAPGWPGTMEAGLAGTMFVSVSNTVAVRLCNLSGASLTPANQTFRATVVRSFP